MKISHIQIVDKPASIIVRNYDNKSIVHFPSAIPIELIERFPDELGAWKVKYYNHVPKELNEIINFEKL
jgi:hypothetical protein